MSVQIYALSTLWLLNLILLPLSAYSADVGYIAFSSYRGENREYLYHRYRGTESPETDEHS